jgi:hypothetical protein
MVLILYYNIAAFIATHTTTMATTAMAIKSTQLTQHPPQQPQQ